LKRAPSGWGSTIAQHDGPGDHLRNAGSADTQRAVVHSVGVARLLGSWVFIRTSSRLIRSPKVDWWPGSVKTSGGLHIPPPGLGHRVADRLRFAKTVAGMDRVLGDSSHRARARDRALRARWRRAGGSACGGLLAQLRHAPVHAPTARPAGALTDAGTGDRRSGPTSDRQPISKPELLRTGSDR